MKILITTGLCQTDVGGPFQYAFELEKEFNALNHEVKVISYGIAERILPIGLRHIYFFLRALPASFRSDVILILDTFSVGFPTILAATIFGKKNIIRVGGDFVWSAYVNRTGNGIALPEFYRAIPNLNLKERIIFFLTKWMIKEADFLAFNTE